MSEKFYIVSESELNARISEAFNAGSNGGYVHKTEAACRAREVEEINAGFGLAWVEVKR